MTDQNIVYYWGEDQLKVGQKVDQSKISPCRTALASLGLLNIAYLVGLIDKSSATKPLVIKVIVGGSELHGNISLIFC